MEFFEYLPGGLAAIAMTVRIAMFFRTGANDTSPVSDSAEA